MKKWLNNSNGITIIAVCILLVHVLGGCKSWNNMARGAAIGGGAGGVVGGVIGSRSGNTVLGTILGATIGGATGAAIGRYMDKQAEEIQKDVKGAKVERIGEGIRITFDSGILFDLNSFFLKEEAKANITELSRVLQKYEDTNVLIEGHTDNTGSDELNMKLSGQRADAVADFAKSLGISGMRISIKGYGETQPIEDNSTETHRANNRRVEIAIIANKKLKKAAKKGII